MNRGSRPLWMAGVALVLAGGAVCGDSGGSSTAMIAQLPVPPGPSRELSSGELTPSQAGQRDRLLEQLPEIGRVTAMRLFLVEPPTDWVAVRHAAGAALEQDHGGRPRPIEGRRPGTDQVALWKLGRLRPRHVVVAMSPDADAEGRRLAAYFELRPGGN